MAQAKQGPRGIAIETPLGKDALLLRSFSAHEEISRLFEIDLDLLSEDRAINFDDIIGQNVTIRVNLPVGGTRYWNGYISRFVQGVSTSRQFTQYRATMVPWLWFLTLTSDCRIFQEKTVPQIIAGIFDDLGFGDVEDRTSGGYPTWTYCVQYRETDFNFISRLMEQEGIYYYFKHEQGRCTLVLCDSRSKHDFFADYNEIPFFPETHSSALQEYISDWTVDQKIRSGKFAHSDYNPLTPKADLITVEEDRKGHAQADYEIFDYPGEYADRPGGEKYAQVRMEELATSHLVCSGQSDSRGICSGYLFAMTRHPQLNQNQDYLFLSTTCHASAEDYETSGGQDDLWACSFTAIPSTVQFRPERTTPKPVITGTQTAVVTGPSGEEIHTDEHGRIKVHFHWDRKGPHDENSSCWIRVAQNWAGAGWGSIYIPRVGQEVIVGFLEGDPDRPIVNGSVYHADNQPPYALPGEKTKSAVKSGSSPGGGGFNEIRFEDKKGEEQLFIHAEKNQDIRVKKDCFEWIGNNRHLVVKTDQKEDVANNRSEKIGADHIEEIGKDRHLKVKGKEAKAVDGSQSLTVKGDVIEVFKANHSEQVTSDYYLKAGNIVIEAMTNVTIKVGQSYIAIEAGGIKIGTMGTLELESTGQLKAKGTAGVKIESPATAEFEGTSTTVKGNAMMTVQGGLVKIN